MTHPLPDLAAAATALADLREQKPLVHNITNYVATTLSANVLLALGASPAMVHAAQEVEEFTSISASLVVNIGTLSPSWVDAMRLAATKAKALGKPWVLDPVGCGATSYRTGVSAQLTLLQPTLIRANASEVLSLAGAAGAGGQGVDSTSSSEAAIEAAAALARATGAVIAVTGDVDYVTDGRALLAIDGGHPLMTSSTALGCALSATVAAFAAVAPPLTAATSALAVYAAAGKRAALACRGPGHMPAELCDALYAMDEATLYEHAAVRPLGLVQA